MERQSRNGKHFSTRKSGCTSEVDSKLVVMIHCWLSKILWQGKVLTRFMSTRLGAVGMALYYRGRHYMQLEGQRQGVVLQDDEGIDGYTTL